jgi:hypothetical protein
MFQPPVTFATTVWERDWKYILLDKDYLEKKQIEYQNFPFAQKLLVINNVCNIRDVRAAAEEKVREGVLTEWIEADQIAEKVFSFFQLKRSDFQPDTQSGVNADWVYYNALGPLTALYLARSPYFLYLTGDVRLDRNINWIEKTLRFMNNNPKYKVANLVWNDRYDEARKESYARNWHFYFAKEGFSDQMFLVRTEEFRQPIYGEIRIDSHHYPRGDVWEKRVYSYMKNRGWERLIYRRGSYYHENFPSC